MRTVILAVAALATFVGPVAAQPARKLPPPTQPGAARPVPPGSSRNKRSDLGNEQQMRLQMMQDRRSKAYESLSNTMKKSSNTNSSIIKNMK